MIMAEVGKMGIQTLLRSKQEEGMRNQKAKSTQLSCNRQQNYNGADGLL